MMRRCVWAAVLGWGAMGVAQTAAPDNSGRKALDDYLNGIAAHETAARREVIARITTRAQAEARQREVRATILRLLGSLPERVPLNVRVTGSTAMDGFRVDKVVYDSQPNFPVTALLYVPSATEGAERGKFPAIVMAPGHSPAAKAGDVAFATAFAKAGFVVLSYDPMGQGERLQYPDSAQPGQSLATRPTGEHGEAGLQPTLIGDALARYFLWDGVRAVDYLESLPEVDPKRIGAFGCSGGGTMTALLGALDPRVAAVGVACYTTSFDALLASATGVQDSEQSTPNFIASGLDFPDWSEMAAPRPYAIIATTEDMFPFAGAQATEAEARRFYGLFGAEKNLAFITGPGHHGNLRPILPQILAFFAEHLKPDAAFAKNLPAIRDPFAADPAVKPGERPSFPSPPPASLVQVTKTGQVSSSFPGAATVYTLNRERARGLPATHPLGLAELQREVRRVTHATAVPGGTPPREGPSQPLSWDAKHEMGPDYPERSFSLPLADGFVTTANYLPSEERGIHRAVLVLTDKGDPFQEEGYRQMSEGGGSVLCITPRPFPQGTEETKSSLLGPFYLTELRAELVGKTLVGMRVDDVIRAIDFLVAQPEAARDGVTLYATGHLGLVALHAAVLDTRIKQLIVKNTLPSYRSLVDDPLPKDAPQDILPGVLRRYDVPDLVRVLGPRLTLDPGPAGNGALP